MRNNIEKLNVDEIEDIFDSSYNYEEIRFWTVNQLSNNYKFNHISNRCRVIFNPYRHFVWIHDYDIGIQKYFDYELLDPELETELAIDYKKTFVSGLISLYNGGLLIR